MDILSTFYGVFMVNCVKLMLRTFEFAVSQFDCFVYHLNIACLKRFARYGHYTGQVEAQSQSSLQSLCCGLLTLC